MIVSAHFDHVGYGSSRNSYGPIGQIHNGADDNASGVAAVVKRSRRLANWPQHPKRSILFAFWDGEEKGLLGERTLGPASDPAARAGAVVINADMVGRLRRTDWKSTAAGPRPDCGACSAAKTWNRAWRSILLGKSNPTATIIRFISSEFRPC